MEKSREIEHKMIELADQLLRSTRAGKLNWREGVRKDSYASDFPDVSLSIANTPRGDFTLELINNEGTVIATLSSETVRLDDFENPEPTSTKLQEIYDTARRQVLDIDGTIEKAIKYLGRGLQ